MKEFTHPGDALRARLRDELNCVSCKHINLGMERWCGRKKYIPTPNLRIDQQYCHKFEDLGEPNADINPTYAGQGFHPPTKE